MTSPLTTTNHDRDIAGLKYVYPVLSRRAGGLSVGINFNINNACNWRCIYCQVPNLSKGAAPDVDLRMLRAELEFFLDDVRNGGFFSRFQIEADKRVIKDIAISGNGEPTSAGNFTPALELIGEIATELNVFPESRFVLITNGSLVHQPKVRAGLAALNGFGGEVWFKFDSATKAGRTLFNESAQSVSSSLENIRVSSQLCPTKIQTCLFDYNRRGLCEQEQAAYLEALAIIKEKTTVTDVLLYTLARPSLQPEAKLLSPLPFEVMGTFAEAIRLLGFNVSVSC